jgi:acyl-CoA dehydrogenase
MRALGAAERALELMCTRAASRVTFGRPVSDDFPLASMYAHLRTLRLADGPDEIHRRTIARHELRGQVEEEPVAAGA